MIFIGDSLVPYEEICKINSIKQINDTKSNSTLIFSYDEELLTYCNKNQLPYAVVVDTLIQAIYANALEAKYIICGGNSFAKEVQEVAENYMFDSKILAIIVSKDEIQEVALKQIDGVIYQEVILSDDKIK